MTNVGTFDRVLRIGFGLLLIVLTLLPPGAPVLAGLGAWRWAVTVVGLVLLATAAFRFCPAYTVLGLNTCSNTKVRT